MLEVRSLILLWLENWAVRAWWRLAIVAAALAVSWLLLWQDRRSLPIAESALNFEERATGDFELLRLA